MAKPIKAPSRKARRKVGRPFEGRHPYLIRMLPAKMTRLRKLSFGMPPGEFIEGAIATDAEE